MATSIRQLADELGLRVNILKQYAGLERGVSSTTELTPELEQKVRQTVCDRASAGIPTVEPALKAEELATQAPVMEKKAEETETPQPKPLPEPENEPASPEESELPAEPKKPEPVKHRSFAWIWILVALVFVATVFFFGYGAGQLSNPPAASATPTPIAQLATPTSKPIVQNTPIVPPPATATTAPAVVPAPDGFCTIVPPNNPGWVVEGVVTIPAGCPEAGQWAMSMADAVTRYSSWTELNTARGGNKATLYFEGATVSVIPTSQPVVTTTTNVVPFNPDRIARLTVLDPIFRNGTMLDWAQAAGFTWTSMTADARQPEEETAPNGTILISGFQVNAVNLVAVWPACFTTDRTVMTTAETRSHQPDLRNPSKLWTNNAPYSGPATIYGDCSNWGQLNP